MYSPGHCGEFCIICLDSNEDCKLFPANMYNLDMEYEHLTGISLQDEMHFAPQFCTECAQRLYNCSKFRDKSLRAYQLLFGLIEKHQMITMQIIKTIDRQGNKLASDIVKKLYKPDHYDFHLTEVKEKHNAQDINLHIKEINSFKSEDSVKDVKCEVVLLDSDCYDDTIVISQDINNEYNIQTINGFKNDMNSANDDVIDITEDLSNEHNIHAVNDLKNDMDWTDCDIDIDDYDDTDYINYDMGTLASDRTKDLSNEHDVHAVNDLKNDIDWTDCDIDINYINYDMETLASEQQVEKERKSNETQLTSNNYDRKTKTKANTVKKSMKQIKSETAICVKLKPVEKIMINEGKQKKIVLKKVKKCKRKKTRYAHGKKFVPSRKLEVKLFQEIELTQEQQKAEIMKRKESDNYKYSWFKCTICYKGFRRLEPYNAHMVKHTDKYGPFECDVCGNHYKNKKYLRKHIRTHRFIYKCTKCPFVSTHRSVEVLHQRWHEGKTYKCTHCDQEFIKYTSRMSHVRIKHPSDFVCTRCGFSFIGEKGLQSHMNQKHSFDDTQDSAGPSCEPCDIRFASEEAYMQHMQVSPKHAAVGQLKINYEKPIYMRTNDMSIECEQCGVKMKGLRRYAVHFSRAHPNKTRAQFPQCRPTSEKQVMCEKCGKVFTAPALLHYHMQVHHTGVKLFECEICHKGFSSDLYRRMHVRGHGGRTSFPCEVCHKEFSYDSNRRRHMRVHEDTRPVFHCKACGKSFISKEGRDSHVRHLHLNVPWPKRVRGRRATYKQSKP